ncbi:hypothetical protein [Methylocystis sp. S23]|jgi:hypothetical protein
MARLVPAIHAGTVCKSEKKKPCRFNVLRTADARLVTMKIQP